MLYLILGRGRHVTLLPLDLQYVDIIFTLSNDPHVKDTLGIKVETVEDTKAFIRFAMEQERKNHSLLRVIVNEEGKYEDIENWFNNCSRISYYLSFFKNGQLVIYGELFPWQFSYICTYMANYYE
ncbi:GCN5-related N-acetyltransferase [Bacillus cereus Rock3-44]|nr:GCN5-related N-acetyltransferase [Bacillus cereus Rock3-44]